MQLNIAFVALRNYVLAVPTCERVYAALEYERLTTALPRTHKSEFPALATECPEIECEGWLAR